MKGKKDMDRSFRPLGTILQSGRSGDHPVTKTGTQQKTWSDLRSDVAAVVRRVRENGSRRWILFSGNGYRFLTGFLALLETGAAIVLPPKPKEGIFQVCAEDAGAALTDQSVTSIPGTSTDNHLRLSGEDSPGDEDGDWSFSGADENARIEFFTSGTTGDRKTIQKSMDHMQNDLDVIDAEWGEEVDNTVMIGTVPHQHIFGLDVRILWPLCRGFPFHPETIRFPDDLYDEVCQLDRPATLLTSPAQLKELARSGVLESLRGSIECVFSGGGKLSGEVVNEVTEQLGFPPLDVFGTTETGAIGWRPSNEESWRPFQGVQTRVDEQGRLLVKSPSVSPTDDWFPTGDHAESTGDSFRLRGRQDRVVNIAETRVALPEVENRIEEHRGVEASAVVVLESEAPERGHRTLGAMIVPSAEGRNMIDDQSFDVLRDELRDELDSYFPSVALPKVWDHVKELPRNDLGNVRVDDVRTRLRESSV